jgi:hypothetical protein
MKPRVFVSSTFYDLKHVRERIERFIESYNFEPVLFESDNVIFEHNKSIDTSCYNEVKLCHIMVLIIGGRYGSVVSGENLKEKKEIYNKEYVSITRREYETALKLNIPIFIFVEKNVHADYQTFKKNKAFFEKTDFLKSENFFFAHVDDINVFNFLNIIQEKPIKTFERVEEIENYLGNQIAGMLFLYLQQLQSNIKEDKILDSVSELQNIVERMNTMLQAVGKNVIGSNSLETVLFNQNKILIDYFSTQFADNITFKNDYYELPKETVAEEAFKVCKNTIFNIELISNAKKEKELKLKYEKIDSIQKQFMEQLSAIDERIIVETFNYYKIYHSYTKNIYPIISSNEKLKEYFDYKMNSELATSISGIPF